MFNWYIAIIVFISFLNLLYIPFDPITKRLAWWEIVLKFVLDVLRVAVVWSIIFAFIKLMMWVFS